MKRTFSDGSTAKLANDWAFQLNPGPPITPSVLSAVWREPSTLPPTHSRRVTRRTPSKRNPYWRL